MNKSTWNIHRTPLIEMLEKRIEHVVARAWYEYIFDSNDPEARSWVANAVAKDLRDAQDLKLIYTFTVKCDETINTTLVISDNEMRVDVHVVVAQYTDPVYIPIRINTF